MNVSQPHLGELALRRRRAGETPGDAADADAGHLAACAECRTRLRALDDEQRRFEQEISFDRFAAGVERAARGENKRRERAARTRLWAFPALAMAAGVALVVTFVPRGPSDIATRPRGENRIKGGAGMTVRIAGAAGQRNARVDAAERLARGERLRVGYQPGAHRYVLALSIDERGEVTPLFPSEGASAPVGDGAGSATRYLPDAWELTGAGVERIVVLLSDQPIAVDAARAAGRAAFERARGNLSALPSLALPGEELSRTFVKP